MPILTSTTKSKTMETSNKTDSKKIDFDRVKQSVVEFFSTHFSKISAETMGWLAAIALHAATVPTLLALLTGLTDSTPSVDVILFMWLGLVLLFGRAVILKDLLNIVTIGLGFVIQAVLMALILFK
jgi:hypothetical protein